MPVSIDGKLQIISPLQPRYLKIMKVLLIDDDPVERSLTIEVLSEKFAETDIVAVDDAETLQRILSQAGFDLVISEYTLHWTDGFQLFHKIHERYACIPFIMLTGSGNEETAVAAIKAGMADYLNKINRSRLPAAITECLAESQLGKICHDAGNNALLCEKWDLAISRLTSDFAYSIRITADKKSAFEWFTEPLQNFIGNEHAKDASQLPVHPDDEMIMQHHISRLLAGHEDTAEYRTIDNDGNIHFFSDHALPIRDWNQGKVVRIYGAIQDVTEQRMAEDKLHLMQRAIDSSNNGIIITGQQGQDFAIIYANQSFLDMTGYSMAELLGRNPRFLQDDDNDQPGIRILRDALDKNCDAHAVLRNYRRDGSLFWNEVYISPVYDKRHNSTHYIGVQNDVTQRVELEKLIRNKEAKMRAIIDNVMDGIIITDGHGRIEAFNPSVATMFNYSARELQGRPIESLFSLDNHHHCPINLAQLRNLHREVWGVTKENSFFPAKTEISQVDMPDNTLLIFTIQDNSDAKLAEQALRKLSSHLEQAREEERSRIAHEIHDELGSKLTAVKMDLSWLDNKLLEIEPNYRQKMPPLFQHIDEAITTVQKIATDLHPSILDHLGLAAALEWQMENFTEQTGLRCHLTLPDEPIEIEEQRATALFRIVQESLTNISRHANASKVEIELRIHDDQLTLSIADNGCGMTSLQMNNPDKFGIQGMRERSRHFGGELSIDSQPEQGCTIQLTMPLTEKNIETP